MTKSPVANRIREKRLIRKIENHLTTEKNSPMSQIPKELTIPFAKMYVRRGQKSFWKTSYNELVKYFGLQGAAPKKIQKKNLPGFTSASYSNVYNSLAVSKKYVEISDEKKINSIAHELKHCKQAAEVITTKGFGLDKYVDAVCEHMAIEDAQLRDILVKNDKRSSNFIENKTAEYKHNVAPYIRKSFKNIEKLPKIEPLNSDNSKVEMYIDGLKNYKDPEVVTDSLADYRQNILEQEAFETGDKLENYYKKFEDCCDDFFTCSE